MDNVDKATVGKHLKATKKSTSWDVKILEKGCTSRIIEAIGNGKVSLRHWMKHY